MKLDIIIPCFNESENIPIIYKELKNTLSSIKYTLIFINDGSKDDSYNVLKDIYNNDKSIKVINFTRNFGKDAAIYAGLKNSIGDIQCIIDADMQQNPIYIKDMYNVLKDNKEIDEVCMINDYRNISKFSRLLKTKFYKIINKLTNINFEVGASDFRMFRKYVTKSILELKEKNRFTKGLLSWSGYNIEYIHYNADKRLYGKSNFNLNKQFKYASNGITNFSNKPLESISRLNILSYIISFIILIILIIQSINKYITVPFCLSIILILIMFNIILTILTIISSYLIIVIDEVKDRPIYLENNSLGIDKSIL